MIILANFLHLLDHNRGYVIIGNKVIAGLVKLIWKRAASTADIENAGRFIEMYRLFYLKLKILLVILEGY
jgi:hypothetical protein